MDLSATWTFDKLAHESIKAVPGWSELSLSDIHVAAVSGGLTNLLCSAELKSHVSVSVSTWHKVLIRIYGKDVSEFYDPVVELQTFNALSDAGIAPTLIGKFDGGRIEEFLEGRVLNITETKNPSVLAGIATKIAQFHKVNDNFAEFPVAKGGALDRSVSWSSKSLTAVHHLEELAKGGGAKACAMDRVIHTLELEDLKLASSKINKLLFPSHLSHIIGEDPLCQVKFCHNDLQENNIIFQPKRGYFRLIDFEYSAFGYVGSDIANFFNEMTYDYTVDRTPFFLESPRAYPDYATQYLFMATYITEMGGSIPTKKQMAQLIDTVDRFAMLSDLLWGFWSLLRQHPELYDESHFDFLEYAKSRFGAFKRKYLHLRAMGKIDDIGIFKES